jgi:dUTP pyrophosphatase
VQPDVVAASAPPTLPIPVVLLDAELGVPQAAHDGDAGLDLCARTDVLVPPGARTLMPTGVALALPPGCVGLVHPRSGLAVRTGLTVLNAPGTVDAGYRGEIMVCLVNHDPSTPVRVRRGDRIAQLVVQRVERVQLVPVDELPASPRGARGHGSSGGHHSLHDGFGGPDTVDADGGAGR